MPECLSHEELRQYGSGAMDIEAMLRADAHIATCASCRAQLLDSPRLARAGESLARKVRWNPRTEFNCLDDEQAAAYVEDTLDAADRELADSHLELCTQCAEDVRSLRQFRAEMAGLPETVYAPETRRARAGGWSAAMRAFFASQRLAWAVAGASLVLAAFFAMQLWMSPQPSLREEQLETRLRTTETQLVGTERELQDAKQRLAEARQQLEQQESELAALRRSEDKPVRHDLAQATAQLFEAGQAAPTEDARQTLAQLVAEGEETRSADESPTPISPVQTLVLSDRPAFHWAPVKGATGYVISLFQDRPRRLLWETQIVGDSEMTFPTDQPPLIPGAAYAWVVEARLPDQSSHSRLVKFQVLDASRRAEVQQLSRRYTGWPIVLAALYEREGLYDEAERELQALVRRNPKSQTARRLLDTLRRRRNTSDQK
jgi:tetratricopeptide (TPR) repeat protein